MFEQKLRVKANGLETLKRSMDMLLEKSCKSEIFEVRNKEVAIKTLER